MANDPEVELRTPCCMAAGTSANETQKNKNKTFNNNNNNNDNYKYTSCSTCVRQNVLKIMHVYSVVLKFKNGIIIILLRAESPRVSRIYYSTRVYARRRTRCSTPLLIRSDLTSVRHAIRSRLIAPLYDDENTYVSSVFSTRSIRKRLKHGVGLYTTGM